MAETLRREGLTCYWEGTIRRSVARDTSGHCAICAVRKDTAKDRVPKFDASEPWAACHEVWRYDFEKRTATVMRFELLCRRCNLATHIGKATARLNAAQMGTILKHIERVNHTDPEGVQRLIRAAERAKARMDSVRWKPLIDHRLIRKFPALRLIRL